MKTLVICIFMCCSLAMIGCGKNSGNGKSRSVPYSHGTGNTSGSNSFDESPARASEGQLAGPSSGGGGYVKTNSEPLLMFAISDLVQMIKMSPLEMWSGLPDDFSRDEFINILENIKLLPDKELTQIDKITKEINSKMFHYQVVDGKREIQALAPFFLAYSATPINNSLSKDSRLFLGEEANSMTVATLRDVQHKLIHEVSHFIDGIEGNDELAHKYASAVMRSFHSNTMICYGLKSSLAEIGLVNLISQTNATWFDQENPAKVLDIFYIDWLKSPEEREQEVRETFKDHWYFRFFTINIHSGQGFRDEVYAHPSVKEESLQEMLKINKGIITEYLNDLNFTMNPQLNFPKSKRVTIKIKSNWIEKTELSANKYLLRTEMSGELGARWTEKELLELTVDRNGNEHMIRVPSHKMAVGPEHEYTSYKCDEHYENIFDNFEKIKN